MSNDNHEEPAKKSKRWMIAVVAPVLYVLSVAPVTSALDFLDKRDVLSYESETKLWDAWRLFYAPMDWASDRSECFSQFLQWYMGLF